MKTLKLRGISARVIIGIVLLWVLFVFVLFFTLRTYKLIEKWDSTSVLEYSGGYSVNVEYTSSKYGPRKALFFYFDNGDIGVSSYIKDFNTNVTYDGLVFKYIASNWLVDTNKHTVVSIIQQNDDGDIIFLDIDESKESYSKDRIGLTIVTIVVFLVTLTTSICAVIAFNPRFISGILKRFRIHKQKSKGR